MCSLISWVFVRQIHMNHNNIPPSFSSMCSLISWLFLRYIHTNQILVLWYVLGFYIFLYFWTLQSMCLFTPVYSSKFGCLKVKICIQKSWMKLYLYESFWTIWSDPIGCISLHIVLPVVRKILIRKRACENI